MELTDARREVLLAYCKLTELADDPEVKLLIPEFYTDAVSYMEDAGISEPKEGSNLRSKYDLCVNAIVLDSWEHRENLSECTYQENPAFRKRMNQLAIRELVSDLDTSSEAT